MNIRYSGKFSDLLDLLKKEIMNNDNYVDFEINFLDTDLIILYKASMN